MSISQYVSTVCVPEDVVGSKNNTNKMKDCDKTPAYVIK